jgi:AAHS family 4-hydroxybenzoate transporter-like MFS transporter
MLGAFAAGPLADRLGRRRILIASVAVFGLFAGLTPMAGSYHHLLLLRFLTGLGLGGASATFVSICAEYAPVRTRATIVAFLWTLLPAGNVLGGVLSSAILPEHGWMPVYYIGGLVPLAIAALMLAFVPESLSFLVSRGAGHAKLSPIVARIAPDLPQGTTTQYVVSEEHLPNASVRHLFGDGRALVTVCLWAAFFCCWLVLITVLAWTVPMLREAGIPISKASLMIAANSGGAVIGAPIIGRIMDRVDACSVVIVGLLAGAVAVASLGFALSSFELLAACAFVAGFTVGGTSAGMIALAAISYPTAIRSTGVGWAIGMSRLGAVVGPVIAGTMLASGWTLQHFFIAMGVLTVFSAIAIAVLKLGTRPLPASFVAPRSTG